MYTIEKTDYGLYIVMGGVVDLDEVQQYIKEKEALLSEFDGPYSMIIDIRSSATPKDELIEIFRQSQERSRDNLLRMSIIVNSPVVQGIAKQVGFQSGIETLTRVINALKTNDWEEVALRWVKNGTEPDQREFTEVTQKIRVNNHK